MFRMLATLALVISTAHCTGVDIPAWYIKNLAERPSEPFDPGALATVDYADDDNWAALPWREDDPSDIGIEGVEAHPLDVAVFYIYPTGGVDQSRWNMTIAEAKRERYIQDLFLPSQPSVFSFCCDVYAPYYQQAAFAAFLPYRMSDGDNALDAAYADVARAFARFRTEWLGERRFVIAGHSQGANHAARLIQEEITGSDLEPRMIAAYLPGARITQQADLTFCEGNRQISCVLAWNAMTPDAKPPRAFRTAPIYHEGAYQRTDLGPFACNPPEPDNAAGYSYFLPDHGASVQTTAFECEGGFWRVNRPKDRDYRPVEIFAGSQHLHEFSIAWAAIGEDLKRRARE